MSFGGTLYFLSVKKHNDKTDVGEFQSLWTDCSIASLIGRITF